MASETVVPTAVRDTGEPLIEGPISVPISTKWVMNFYADFDATSNVVDLRRFLAKYGFKKVEPEKRWNLGQYELRHDGWIFGVGYRRHDPSQAFSIQKDIHKAEL